jgi:hypothetical protein
MPRLLASKTGFPIGKLCTGSLASLSYHADAIGSKIPAGTAGPMKNSFFRGGLWHIFFLKGGCYV